MHRRQCNEKIFLIAQSLKRQNELEEERSALMAYRKDECDVEEDLADCSEYLRLHRKDSLKAPRQHISVATQRTSFLSQSHEKESLQSSRDGGASSL